MKISPFLFLFLFAASLTTYSQKVVKNYFYDRTLREEFVINQNGFKEGFYKEYYGNKMPKITGQYKNDLMEGEWKYFKADGKHYKIETYKNGKWDGLWRNWNESNNYRTILVDHYYANNVEIRIVSYYPGGGIQSDISIEGECKVLYQNGKIGKTWRNQNNTPIPSSVMVYSTDGTLYKLEKIIEGNKTYTRSYDLEYDYSGEKSGSIGYYITTESDQPWSKEQKQNLYSLYYNEIFKTYQNDTYSINLAKCVVEKVLSKMTANEFNDMGVSTRIRFDDNLYTSCNVDFFETKIQNFEAANNYAVLGRQEFKKGNIDSSISLNKQALALNNGFIYAKLNLGLCYLVKNDMTSANEYYNDALIKIKILQNKFAIIYKLEDAIYRLNDALLDYPNLKGSKEVLQLYQSELEKYLL